MLAAMRISCTRLNKGCRGAASHKIRGCHLFCRHPMFSILAQHTCVIAAYAACFWLLQQAIENCHNKGHLCAAGFRKTPAAGLRFTEPCLRITAAGLLMMLFPAGFLRTVDADELDAEDVGKLTLRG